MMLLVDMNLSPRWVHFLKEAGIDAIHWSQVGRPDASDIEIMQYAKANDFVVLTNDLDFSAILSATNGAKPSVIQIRSVELNPNVIGDAVVRSIRQVEPELMDGALLSFEPTRSRLRLLPLR